MADVKKLHQSCPSFEPVLDFSLDGIQESKSSPVSADVYCVSFKGCKQVYPIRIVREMNKYKVNEQKMIKAVVDDINVCQCHLETVVGDNPKRSNLRCALCHSASFAYEYCESKAQYIRDAVLNNKGHLAWPSNTAYGTPRTIENIREITRKIEENHLLPKDECKGFVGTSHLLYQPNFHFIKDMPSEYMHLLCLGVVKRLVELTFNVGESRKRITTRKLSDVSLYNKLISAVQLFREFSRRLRNLDFGVMKAQEYRNIILFFFTLVLECIPSKYTKERKLWLQLAFVARACVISNAEYDAIPKKLIRDT